MAGLYRARHAFRRVLERRLKHTEREREEAVV